MNPTNPDLTALLKQISDNIVELEHILQQFESNFFEKNALFQSRIETAWTKLEQHEKEINELRKITQEISHSVTKIESFGRIQLWVGTILGGTVIVWILSQFLHLLE